MYYSLHCLASILLLQGISCYAEIDHIHDQQLIHNDDEPLHMTIKPDKVKRSTGKLFMNILYILFLHYKYYYVSLHEN